MRLSSYPETDSLYVALKTRPGTSTRDISNGLSVDLDASDKVVGFDIDHASRGWDPSALEPEALPVRSIKVG